MIESPSQCFPPAVSPETRLLILGSLPGEQSLARQQYYGHPRNQFWRLVSEIAETDLTALDYQARLERLSRSGIGLWDVVASAIRPGSLDQHMRSVVPNRLIDLIGALPRIEAIAFNGSTASRIGRRQIMTGEAAPAERIPTLIDLPSSSPANTMTYVTKAEAWRPLRRHVQTIRAAAGNKGNGATDGIRTHDLWYHKPAL